MAGGLELAKAYVQIIPTTDGIAGNIASLLGGESASAGKSAGSNFSSSFASSLTGVGSTLTETVSRPLAGVFREIMDASMDYEAGMSEVKAISGATADEMSLLGEKAMDMASVTKFTTAETAEAYKYMAMAGWDTADMVNSLSAVMYLAGASGESLGRTSDIVTDAMTAFGMAADENSKVLKDGYIVEVSNAQRFTDVLAAASNNANTNVDMLGESFKYVAPIAGSMAYSVEDTAIALGLMANSGIKAAMGGTALRNILVNMANPTSNMAAAMDALGVSLDDGEGNMYTLKEIMDQLRASFSDVDVDLEGYNNYINELTAGLENGIYTQEEYNSAVEGAAEIYLQAADAQKASLAASLAGKYGMAGLLSIVTATEEDYNRLAEAIYNSNGATQEMYEITTDNAQGAVMKLDSALNVLFTSLGEYIIPAFTELVLSAVDAVNWFNGLDDGAKKLILTLGMIAIAIGPVLTVAGNIVQTVGLIGPAVSGVTTVVSTSGSIIGTIISAISGGVSSLFALIVANPIVLVIAAIVAAAVAAAVLIVKNWDEIKAKAKEVGKWISDKFTKAAEDIEHIWGAITGFFSGIWDGIMGVFSGIGEWFHEKFSDAKERAAEAWSNVKERFSEAYENVKSAFADAGDWFREKFTDAKEKAASAWGDAREKFSGVYDKVKSAFADVGEWFHEKFTEAKEKAASAWSDAKEKYAEIYEEIKSAFDGVADWFHEKFSDAKDWAAEAWSNAKEKFSEAYENVKSVFADAGDWFREKFETARDKAVGAWDNISSKFSTVWDNIKGAFKLGDALTWGRDMMGNFIKGIREKWDGLKEAVSNIGQGIKDRLGHSHPKTGPLADDYKWMPDMMELFAKGIRDNERLITEQLEDSFNFSIPALDYPSIRVGNVDFSGTAGSLGRTNNTTYSFTFNSPERLDPVSAARETKKVMQQMAMGYV